MKKYYLGAAPVMKHLVLSVCLFGVLAANASGQAMPERLDVPQAIAPLPSISNMRPEARRQQPNPPAAAAPATRPGGTARGPFEIYVEAVTGKGVGIFGRDLFSEVSSTFAPFDGAQVNPDYVIGTGDELQIRGWGMVDIDLNATVDRSGAIHIPRVGSVRVAGVKYSDLQGHLKKAVGKIYTNFELTASISQTRAVQIYVVGHAVRPGTYTLSAMSTLLNALFTSGGPDASGSMRNIQLKRGTGTVATFDLYDMLLKGDKSRDLTLRDGDVIYIPEVGSLVALTGNVKQPAIFELKGPASLAELITWAGGFDSATDSKQVIVEKNVNNQYQTVAELSADQAALAGKLGAIAVHPTDIIRVFSPGAFPVQVQIQNEYVRVAGEVRQSGVFQLRKGETLRELMVRLGGVTDNGYVFATQLNRESLKRSQQLKLNEAADRFERDIDIAAKARMSGATDKDTIASVSAEFERQRGQAQRMRMVRAEGRLVLELPGGDAQIKHLPDLPLHDGDSVYVPRKPGTVDVIGSVFAQNSFIYRPHRTVGDYIAMAGGVTASADKSETYLIRADGTSHSGRNTGWLSGVRAARISPGDTVVVPEDIERHSWTQSLKEWTAILYQFGLGAAGISVLK